MRYTSTNHANTRTQLIIINALSNGRERFRETHKCVSASPPRAPDRVEGWPRPGIVGREIYVSKTTFVPNLVRGVDARARTPANTHVFGGGGWPCVSRTKFIAIPSSPRVRSELGVRLRSRDLPRSPRSVRVTPRPYDGRKCIYFYLFLSVLVRFFFFLGKIYHLPGIKRVGTSVSDFATRV